jgi:hypothetical protein
VMVLGYQSDPLYSAGREEALVLLGKKAPALGAQMPRLRAEPSGDGKETVFDRQFRLLGQEAVAEAKAKGCIIGGSR